MRNLSRLVPMAGLALFVATASASPMNQQSPEHLAWAGETTGQNAVQTPVPKKPGFDKMKDNEPMGAAGHSFNKLVNEVATQTGVSTEQAWSGLGLLFNLDRQRLPRTQFQKLSQAVPKMTEFLQEGKATARDMPTLALDAKTGPRLDPNNVFQMMKRLGYTPGQIKQTTQVIQSYLEKHKSEQTSQVSELFQRGVKPVTHQLPS